MWISALIFQHENRARYLSEIFSLTPTEHVNCGAFKNAITWLYNYLIFQYRTRMCLCSCKRNPSSSDCPADSC
jgi:hypothetical protein